MKNSSAIKNVHNTLTVATQELQQLSIASSRLDSIVLLCHALKRSRVWLLANPSYVLNIAQQQKFSHLLERRKSFEPIAYITNEKEFYGRTFIVNKHVLVPRPESEDLVEMALCLKLDNTQVIDIGTGSGILGLTLKLEQPSVRITLSDISAEALKVAQDNARQLGVGDTISYRNQSLLDGDTSCYDLILANLPYVPQFMSKNSDLLAEPIEALFAGVDGLNCYRDLFLQLKTRDTPVPLIITESMSEQHVSMERIAAEAGYKRQQVRGLAQLFSLEKTTGSVPLRE